MTKISESLRGTITFFKNLFVLSFVEKNVCEDHECRLGNYLGYFLNNRILFGPLAFKF